MKCKECKYWERSDKNKISGYCDNKKFIYNEDVVIGDELTYRDAECYAVILEMGENFGCIHFDRGIIFRETI